MDKIEKWSPLTIITGFNNTGKTKHMLTNHPNGKICKYCRYTTCNDDINEIKLDLRNHFNSDFSKLKDFLKKELDEEIDFDLDNRSIGQTRYLNILLNLTLHQDVTTMLVVNPELFLHPYLQSKLMEIFTKRVNEGKNTIIIETQSDHIVNGALVNMKLGNIKKEDVSVYFFNKEKEIQKLEIGDDCRIKRPPYGFFDQMNKDLNILFMSNDEIKEMKEYERLRNI